MMFSGDHKSERMCLLGSANFYCSDSEHEMEGELLKLLRQTKEAVLINIYCLFDHQNDDKNGVQ